MTQTVDRYATLSNILRPPFYDQQTYVLCSSKTASLTQFFVVYANTFLATYVLMLDLGDQLASYHASSSLNSRATLRARQLSSSHSGDRDPPSLSNIYTERRNPSSQGVS